ncbi:hypothetical protein NC652_029021 [Populus alba x Populus x berolinensis]|nr:hypothetical protein NC652_029021 [Populus alba x Populus x berolinensis]
MEVVRSLCLLIGFLCCNACVLLLKRKCKIELLFLLIAKSSKSDSCMLVFLS